MAELLTFLIGMFMVALCHLSSRELAWVGFVKRSWWNRNSNRLFAILITVVSGTITWGGAAITLILCVKAAIEFGGFVFLVSPIVLISLYLVIRKNLREGDRQLSLEVAALPRALLLIDRGFGEKSPDHNRWRRLYRDQLLRGGMPKNIVDAEVSALCNGY